MSGQDWHKPMEEEGVTFTSFAAPLVDLSPYLENAMAKYLISFPSAAMVVPDGELDAVAEILEPGVLRRIEAFGGSGTGVGDVHAFSFRSKPDESCVRR